MKWLMLWIMAVSLVASSAYANGIYGKIEEPGDDGFPAHEIGAIFQFWTTDVIDAPTARNFAEQLCNCVVSNFDAQQFTHLRSLVTNGTRTVAQIRDAIILFQVGIIDRAVLYNYFQVPNNLKDPEDQD